MSVVAYGSLPRDAQRTPLDWRKTLLSRLQEQMQLAAIYEMYYDGEHPLQFATSKWREAFGNLFSAFADNWCQIVVDSAVERLHIVGFRINDEDNSDAWDIWQANALDVESMIAHTEAGKCGRAYLLVDPNGEDGPRITVEHSAQVVVALDPADRRKRLAGLKRWLGDDQYQYATLYLPDVILKFESSKAMIAGQSTEIEWVPRSGEDPEVPNPYGVVPVIPLENKPGLLGNPHSDLDPAIPLQNAINKLATDMIVTSEYAGFPQRVVTGVEVPKDPTTGLPLADAEMKAAMSRMWMYRPADAKVTSLPVADLANFVNSIEMFVQHMAAQTRTPPHYLLAKMVNMSGDALTAAEAGLVSKCRAKQLFFSDSWEEAMALALSTGSSEIKQADVEAIWQDPERLQPSQMTDAAIKKKTLGIPLPVIWLELGYTPEQIEEMTKELESQQQAELEAAAQAEAAIAKETLVAAGQLEPTPAPAGASPAPPGGPSAPPAPPAPSTPPPARPKPGGP